MGTQTFNIENIEMSALNPTPGNDPPAPNGRPPAEFWLVRHGQTDWNLEGRYQGQVDRPLNETGLQQARELAQKLAGTHFDAVYSSDLQRALATARILAGGREVIVDRRLREINQGALEGKLFAAIQDEFPELISNRRANPLDTRPPGGESLAEVAERVTAFADQAAAQHPGQRVLLVSHGLALAILLTCTQGLGVETAFKLIPGNAEPKVITWPCNHRKENPS